jgi:site-specific DNA-methyltransferase (adenine-specific)
VTPYYQDDHATIYHGDCRDVLPLIRDVDVVFTSPPYNLGTTNGGRSGMHPRSLAAKNLAGGYQSYDDAMPQTEYDIWQRWLLLTLWQSLSDVGAIFYNHKPRIQGGVAKLPTDYGLGLPLRQVIVWDRGTGMNFSQSFFLPKHEWLVLWAKENFGLRDKSASQVGDVWRIPPEQDTTHPAPFPLALPTTAIGATNANLVLDPFMGSGTTLRAAKDLGRKAIGIEIEERYCEIAAKRLAQEVLPL